MTDLPVEAEKTGTPKIATKLVPVLGREVLLREPSQLQLAVLGRSYRRAAKAMAGTNGEEATEEQVITALDSIAVWLDVMEGYFVHEADRDFVERAITSGQLRGFADMTPLLSAFQEEEEASGAKPNRTARRAKR